MLQHHFHGLSQVQVLHGQMLPENTIYITLRIQHRHIPFTHHDQTVVLLPRVIYNQLGGILGYRMA